MQTVTLGRNGREVLDAEGRAKNEEKKARETRESIEAMMRNEDDDGDESQEE